MNIDVFKEEINKLNISYDDEMFSKLEEYYNLLVSWNSKMNLTAITEKSDVYLKHFYDSLTIVKVIDLNSVSSLCDIGTGAGFPGVVLKIFFPHLKISLIDSLGKRIKFLECVVDSLKLSDVTVINTRAEDYSRKVREKYDVVTARAVASFNVLLEYSIPLVNVDRYFVAMRGSDDSINSDRALKLLDSSIIRKDSFLLPYEKSMRTLVLIKKNNSTNLKYPRRYSEIKKNPL